MKRVKPLYKQIVRRVEEERTIPVGTLLCSEYAGEEYGEEREGDLIISPYSEYIPLQYIFLNTDRNKNYRPSNISEESYGKLSAGLFRDKLMFEMAYYQNGFENSLFLRGLSKWMEIDGVANVREIGRRRNRAWNENDVFARINNSGLRYYGRSYELIHSPYSLYLSIANSYIFHAEVLAVVLPENYLYQKYKILMDGCIDMSRVIILVNKDLSTTAYDCPPFKKWYRKYLMQSVLESGADVWEVPREYIREKCFLGKFSLSGMNIFEKRKAKADIIDAFCKYMQEEGIEGPIAADCVVYTGSPDVFQTIDTRDIMMENFEVTLSQNPLERITNTLDNLTWTSSYAQIGIDAHRQGIPSNRLEGFIGESSESPRNLGAGLYSRLRNEYPIREEDTMPIEEGRITRRQSRGSGRGITLQTSAEGIELFEAALREEAYRSADLESSGDELGF